MARIEARRSAECSLTIRLVVFGLVIFGAMAGLGFAEAQPVQASSSGRAAADSADLVLVSVEGDAFAFAGQPYHFAVEVRNDGGSLAQNVEVSLHFSDNTVINTFDPQIGTLGPFDLAGGDRIRLEGVSQLAPPDVQDLDEGQYYLGAIVDVTSQVTEPNEVNNIGRAADAVWLRAPAPDFMTNRLRAVPVGAVGEPFIVEERFANEGNISAIADFTILLSSTPDLAEATAQSSLASGSTGRAYTIGAGKVFVEPQHEVSLTQAFLIPADVLPGLYFVACVVDPTDEVDELVENNNAFVSSSPVTILRSNLVIQNDSLPLGFVGTEYTAQLSAMGGRAPSSDADNTSGEVGPRWAILSGLPPSLELDPREGRIFGVPSEEGSVALVVEVTDGEDRAIKTLTLATTAPTIPLEIETEALPPAYLGRPFFAQMAAVGGVGAHVFSTSSQLPAGLRLDPSGRIEGVVADEVIRTLVVRVTDQVDNLAERALVLRVLAPRSLVHLSTTVPPDGRLGQTYSFAFSPAVGAGDAPYRYDVTAGSLPPGLSLADDTVSGAPTKAGVFAFDLELRDARGDIDVKRYFITIRPDQPLQIVNATVPEGVLGVEYGPLPLHAVVDEDASAIQYAVVSGRLPAGIELSADGQLHGTPRTAGVSSFLVRVEDDRGRLSTVAFALLVRENDDDLSGAPATLSADASTDGCRCVAASMRGVRRPTQASNTNHRSFLLGVLWVGALLGLRRLRLPRWLSRQLCLRSPGSHRACLRVRRRWSGSLRVRLGVLLTLSCFASAQAIADVPYRVESFDAVYVEKEGGARVLFSAADSGFAQVLLPFSFPFFGVRYNSMLVSSLGYVSFGSNADERFNTAIPNFDSPNNLIALFWDDVRFTEPSDLGVSLFVEGDAPNRSFIVQYRQVVPRYGEASDGRAGWQLRLYEGASGRFEILYGPLEGYTPASNEWSGSVGFEDAQGVEGASFLSCTPGCPGSVLSALNGHGFRAQRDGGRDLIAGAVSAPSTVYPGVPFDVRFAVSSVHASSIGPFTIALRRESESESEGASGTPLWLSEPTTLLPFETRALSASVELPIDAPTGVGAAVLEVEVDAHDEIEEPDEANNIQHTVERIRVDTPLTDFVVHRVEAKNVLVASPGDRVDVTTSIANVGYVDGESKLRFVLSRNSAATSADVVAEERPISLLAGTTSTVAVSLMLPPALTAGTWYVGAIVDPAREVNELVEVNNVGIMSTPIRIVEPSLVFVVRPLPDAHIGVPYSTFLMARGGDGDHRFSIDRGALPDGLHLVSTTGEIRGTPTQLEDGEFTLRVTSGGQSETANFHLAVRAIEAGLVILTRTMPDGRVGIRYPGVRIRVLRSGSGPDLDPLTFELAGDPPPGLILDATGQLSGVPTQAGVFGLSVTVRDGESVVSKDIEVAIVEPSRFMLRPDALPDGRLEVPYQFALRTLGRSEGEEIVFFSEGPMPRGLSLTDDGRVIGTPLEVGRWMFDVEARDKDAPNVVTDRGHYRITVSGASGSGVLPLRLPDANEGEVYSAIVNMDSEYSPIEWSVEGPPLPAGLSYRVLDDHRLEFYGTPTEAELVALKVIAVDATMRTTEHAYALRVLPIQSSQPTLHDDGSSCACIRASTRTTHALDQRAVFNLVAMMMMLAAFALTLRPWRLAARKARRDGLLAARTVLRFAMRAGLASIFFIFLISSSACEGTNFSSVEPDLEVSPSHLDFEEVELGQPRRLSLKLESRSSAVVQIEGATVEADCDQCFAVFGLPSEIAPYQAVDVSVQFRPDVVGVLTGTVTLASNDPQQPIQSVTLVGRGRDDHRPDLEVSPTEIDFGSAASGGQVFRTFEIRSTGTNDLWIDSMRIDPAGAPFRITTSTPTPENPGRLAPGASAAFSVVAGLPEASSVASSTVSARILIASNVPDVKNVPGQRGVVAVGLSARPNLPPVAVVGPDQSIEPWRRVFLDGSMSYDQDDPPNTPLEYVWTLVERPSGSTAVLERAASSAPTFWADLTGTYVVELVVVDALGVESTLPARTVIQALPSNVIRIELTWDHPDADLDLHLIRDGGTFCDCDTDVHYRDCARAPDWFKDAPGANPRLDVDDRGGFGPENINLDGDGPSRYIPDERFEIAVHYYATNQEISDWPTSTTRATVRVFIYGLLAGEFARTMEDEGEVWYPAVLDWPLQRFVSEDRVTVGAHCGVF
ncbi:MAG: putative Ig domain-containing protein [Deltaproteobacteria bacterium]|nr:putative Ig domain-containing protein [Deltaproteobacteria bacterium]